MILFPTRRIDLPRKDLRQTRRLWHRSRVSNSYSCPIQRTDRQANATSPGARRIITWSIRMSACERARTYLLPTARPLSPLEASALVKANCYLWFGKSQSCATV